MFWVSHFIILVLIHRIFQKSKKSRKAGARSTCERIMVLQAFPLCSKALQTTLRDL